MHVTDWRLKGLLSEQAVRVPLAISDRPHVDGLGERA
jgi:hypothetical protein